MASLLNDSNSEERVKEKPNRHHDVCEMELITVTQNQREEVPIALGPPQSDGDSEEEVRQKPNRHDACTIDLDVSGPPETFDILLIGRTGYGKSSTADKLMVPNSQELPTPGEASAIIYPSSQATMGPQDGSANHYNDNHTDENEDKPVKWENLTGWVLSADEQESINTDSRLKNIVFCRDTRRDCEPHIHIDKLRGDSDFKNIYSSSKSCQLLTNDDSKIRVLDAPGFFSPDLMEGAITVQGSNLAIVRHIVRIQAIADLKFKRVLYFLPVRGKLERADRTINEELQELIKFFGVSVFRNMVLVATTVKALSEIPHMPSEDKFSQRDLTDSQANFNIALQNECQRRGVNIEDLPTPPIIFIAMTDTCEQILHKIKQAPVHDETGPQLVFNSQHCIKCGMEIVIRDKERLMCEYRANGANNWSEAIDYKDSYCHPKMVPVYTVTTVLKGVAGLFKLRWLFSEEKCINIRCNRGPGSRGCIKVGSSMPIKDARLWHRPGGDITVDHTSRLDD